MTMSRNDINEYIRKTLKKSEGILAELEEYAKQNHVPIIQPETARLLVVLGNLQKPLRILEVGTAIGYSSILMSSFLEPQGRIDTIERHDAMVFSARNNIKKAGLDAVINVIAGDASDVLKNLDKQYDMVFMDAAKGQYLDFLPDVLRMLRPGGLLVSDNVLFRGMVASDELIVRRKKTIVKRMRDYLDTISRSEILETSILPAGDGVAISYKKYGG